MLVDDGFSVLDTDCGIIGERKAVNEVKVVKVPIGQIFPNPYQPRKSFDEAALEELSASIAQYGVLQPLLVSPAEDGRYLLIAGERRLRASRMAKLTEVPVIISDYTTQQIAEIALIENLQREDLNPVEEAFGYQQLIESCGLTQEQAAQRVAKSRPAVANALRLLALPAEVLQYLRGGKLSAGHARAILSIEGDDARVDVAKTVLQKNLNVRQTEALCRQMSRPHKERAAAPRPALPCEVELSLQEALGTEVGVKYKEGKGTLSVHFYSDDQLRAFANLLGNYEKEKRN